MSRSSYAETVGLSRRHRRWVPWLRWLSGLSLLALLLVQATGHIELSPLSALERYGYDTRLRLLAPQQLDPRIVILDIDERALAEQGRWPWQRGRLAELISMSFKDHGAVAMGLDLILTEADESSGLAQLERLAAGPLRGNANFAEQLVALRPQLDDDGQLAQVLSQHPVVLGFYFSDASITGRSAALPTALPTPTPLPEGLQALPNWRGHGGNLARLQDAASQAGFLNALADDDGITRRSLLLARQDQNVYASLPLQLAQTLLNSAPPQPILAADGSLSGVQLNTPRGPLRLATDAQGSILVPYRSAAAEFSRVSAADLWSGRLAPGAFSGRVVLLGSSAPGLLDQRASPLKAVFAGVAVHATVLAAILDGTLAYRPAYAPALEVATLLLVATALLLLLPRLSLLAGAGLVGVLMLACLSLNFWAWRQWHEAWPLSGPLLLAVSLFSLHLLLAHAGERAARRQLTRLFGQYVPPALVAEMSRRPEQLSLVSHNAELTVMFADIRGFTGISERLSPADLAELMNAYFSAMSDIIGAHRGTVDKYIGDAVMAFWGAPLPDNEHARHAVQTALAMQASLAELNRRFATRDWPALRISIGINTGSMVVGDLGSSQRRAYTVLGDAVNLAARLQALCGEREAQILIGADTHAAIGDTSLGGSSSCIDLGPQQLRGRDALLRVFQVAAVDKIPPSIPFSKPRSSP